MSEFLNLVLGDENDGEEGECFWAEPPPEENVYKVTLEKGGNSYGLGYRAVNTRSALVVTALVTNSPVTEWNKICDVNECICVGDRIMCVNGKEANSKEMVNELLSSTKAEITLMKSGPRWHIMGVTADCLDKIDKAVQKGMVFETKLPEDDGARFIDHQDMEVSCWLRVVLFAVLLIPNMVLLATFSDIGYGLYVYGLFAPTSRNWIGNGMIFAASLFAVALYASDWTTWEKAYQRHITGALCVYGYAVAFIFKCRYYPFAPLVICLFHVPIFLGILRVTVFRYVVRSKFYMSAFQICLTVGILSFVAWLLWLTVDSLDGSNMWNEATKDRLAADAKTIYDDNKLKVNGVERSLDYLWDCKLQEDFGLRWEFNQRIATEYTLGLSELNERDRMCGQVKTIWFLMWLSPFIGAMTNIIIAVFCLVNGLAFVRDGARVEKMLKATIFLACCILMAMWVSTSIAGASMRLTGTLLAFCGASMIALMIWVYLEIGKRAITTTIRNSKIMQTIVALATSDWVRAGLIIAFNGMIPLGFLVSILNQKVRRLRGRTTSKSMFTEGATVVLNSLASWNWGSVFVKVNWWVAIYWLFSVGVAKATYVFLSWLNVTLQQVDFAIVLLVFFAIGLTMFMLPPVPGIPVYITSGIVIAARASSMSVGYWGGVAIAVALSFVLKLVACSGQYLIGYCMGKSVKIQQLCMVDKVGMKAAEKILRTRGFSLPKVAALVGGPDWPTSVLCGIMRLNLCQILLGTTPVIVVLTPCVLAGAFLAGPNSGSSDEDQESDGMWSTIATTALALSFVVQLASMILASYYIQDTMYKHSEELAKPRPEHEPVIALTRHEAHQVKAYMEMLEWRAMTSLQKGIILTSVLLSIASFIIFIFMDEACFRPFQVNSKIDAPYGKGGLGGNAISIVLWLGWVAQGMYTAAMVLQVIFLCIARRRGRARFQEMGGERSMSTSISGDL